MAIAVLQYTNNSDLYGDFVVFDDLTVEKGGVPDVTAVATFVDGQYRLDVEGLGAQYANMKPPYGDLVIFRQPGWAGSTGWKAVLTGWSELEEPTNISIGVYGTPGVSNYLWTPGKFAWDPVNEWYEADCSPGFEPSIGEDAYFAFLTGSLAVSPFTYFSQWIGDTFETGQGFSGGGDFSA